MPLKRKNPRQWAAEFLDLEVKTKELKLAGGAYQRKPGNETNT